MLMLMFNVRLLRVRRAGDIERLLHGLSAASAAGECGQRHVVSVYVLA